jgi:Tol biopolymer transport system component
MGLALPLRAVVVGLLALAIAAPAADAFTGRNGNLVYGWSQLDEPDVGPSWHYVEAIRSIAPRGGEPRTVTGCDQTLPVQAPEPVRTCVLQVFADPAVSRDGVRIAFDHGTSLALVNPDGSDLQVLPAQSADDGEPAFSAAGGRIAFSAGFHSTGSGGDGRAIWIRDIARGTARRAFGGTDPAWSSRNWIAFESNDTDEIWMARPGGRGMRRLTSDGSEPAWSPHGRKLAFARGRSILVLDLATRRVRRVERGVDATDLAWSPDGRRLAYTLFDGGVWTVRIDGTRARELVPGGVNGTSSFGAAGVDWQPLR